MNYPSGTHVSAHLTWAELACKDHLRTSYPVDIRDRAVVLAQAFEAIRGWCGHQPIHVLSGYRTLAHNARIGGARNSQHIQGRALDLTHSTLSIEDFTARVLTYLDQHRDSPVKGIGIYKNFLHIDIRPSKSLVRWEGSRQVADRYAAW